MSAFCLFTGEQIKEFVFKTIDLDEDLYLSKTDILLFLYMER